MTSQQLALTTLASGPGGDRAETCACGCGKPLTGRQKRFATRPCAAREYDQQHPRANRGPNGPREGTAEENALRVLEANTHQSLTIYEIAEQARLLPTTLTGVMARLKKRGYRIESDAKTGNGHRIHRYRLAPQVGR